MVLSFCLAIVHRNTETGDFKSVNLDIPTINHETIQSDLPRVAELRRMQYYLEKSCWVEYGYFWEQQ